MRLASTFRPRAAAGDGDRISAETGEPLPMRWDVASVMHAIDEHESGRFRSSHALVQGMGRDDRVSAVMSSRTHAVLARNGDFSIEPPKGGDQRLADLVLSWWETTLPDSVLGQLVRSMTMLGVAFARVSWTKSKSAWTPTKVDPWSASSFSWDANIGRFVVATKTGQESIDPDDPNWIVLEPGGSRSWMSGGVRALGVAFAMRSFNWKDWARFNERHGLPIIAISEPAGFLKEDRDRFYAKVRSLGSSGIIRLPQQKNGEGFDLQFREPKDKSWESFSAFRRDLDVSIAVAHLGQNLLTEVSGGSYGAAKAQDQVRRDYRGADIEVLSTSLRAQLIQRWGRLNFRSWSDDDAAWPTWKNEDPVDRQATASAMVSSATAIEKLQASGLPVDMEELCRTLGVPLLKKAKRASRDAGAEDGEDASPPTEPAQRSTGKARAILASGGDTEEATGFVSGQLYADDLVDDGVKKARALIRPVVEDLQETIRGATGYEQVRAAILQRYQARVPLDELRDLVQKGIVLARLSGRLAVREDAQDARPET